VEGLPGTGKSSTAEFIAEYLSSSGVNARWYDDQDLSHPADYTFHAFMREDQLRKLAPDEQRQVLAEGQQKQDGLIIPLTKISVNLFEKILPYKIYGNLDWKTEKTLLTEHWREFADEWQWSNAVHVFDSCLVQNPVGEMMMRFDLGFEEIRDYIRTAYDVIAKLNPVVIYLKSTDVKTHFETLYGHERPGALDMWVELHTSQGYGKRQGLSGDDGYIACLKARQQLELDILKRLDIPRLVIDNPYDDWEGTERRLTDYLDRLFEAKARA
jgi:hypothetical protein